MNTRNTVLMVVALVVVGAGAFLGGMQFEKHKGTTTSKTATGTAAGGQFAGRTGARGGAGGGFGGGGVTGTIVSMDASSITVKTPNGSSEIVYFSSSTPVIKQVVAASTDLAAGDNVVIRGSSSNGTVTASSISVVPTLPTAPTGTPSAKN